MAMDFSQAFTWGAQITARLATIGYVQEEAIYGLFDEFRPFVTSELVNEASARLSRLEREAVKRMIAEIPREWGVGETEGAALLSFTCDRARWLSVNLGRLLELFTRSN
jgi:hypothetical protein